jgi:hypothetical protein
VPDISKNFKIYSEQENESEKEKCS